MRRPASELDSVPPSALAAYRRETYAKTVLDVITSDPQLTEMATDLVRLYQEMELAQNRYVQMRQSAGLCLDATNKRPRGRLPRNP